MPSPTCDFCSAAIDIASPDALVVAVHRGMSQFEWEEEDEGSFISGGVDTFRFCSQAHHAEHAAALPLPVAPKVDLDADDDGSDVVFWLFAAFWILLFVALLVGGSYGLFLLVDSWR